MSFLLGFALGVWLGIAVTVALWAYEDDDPFLMAPGWEVVFSVFFGLIWPLLLVHVTVVLLRDMSRGT